MEEATPVTADRTTTQVAVRKALYRLLPLLMLLYMINYIDRVNIGFAAASTFNADLGLSAAAYGFGAGLFFIGYFVFEVPSNIILHRVGARLWIARIMITWGIVATSTAYIQGEVSFYIVRVLLGVAEAGFFPGIILYLTYWFPRAQRAKIVALFFMAVPLASVIGSPISALLIQNGAGTLGFVEGWRFMFFVEGLPAILLGVLVIFLLPSKPRDARWLSREEATALEGTIAAEDAQTVTGEVSIRSALTNSRVMLLSLVYFGVVFGLYVLGFFLPTVIKGFGTEFGIQITLVENGLITAIPYAFATVAMYLWSRHSDSTGERRWHVAIPVFVGAVGIVGSIFMTTPTLVMVCITICTIGVFSAIPVFWQLPNAFLTGVGAAAGIALINSFGNLAGFAGPFLTGLLRDLTGSTAAGLWIVAAFMVMSGVIVLSMQRQQTTTPPLSSTTTTKQRT